jgi:hypothetical protein
MADIFQPERNLSSLNSFARAATPEYWGLDPGDYADITPHMLELVETSNLHKSLIGVPKVSQFSVGYLPGLESRPVFIALTPTEYSLIARYVPGLATAAVSQTLKSRRIMKNNIVDTNAAKRSGVHALEGRQAAMETYLKNSIQRDQVLLEKFAEAAKNPSRWRMRESEMRVQLGWVMESVFGDMFTTIRYQRQWSPGQEDLARRAVERRLFFERQRNQHLQYWRDMFSLNLEYSGNKQALFLDRIWQTKQLIAKKKDASKG